MTILANRIFVAVAAMLFLSAFGQDFALAQNSEIAKSSSADAITDSTGARTVTFGTSGGSTGTLTEAHPEAKQAHPESKGNTLVLKGGTTDSSSYEDALAIEAPQPELPPEHNEQGIKTSCCARFTIEEDGKFSVRLVSSTGSQEVDELALATLRRWKFKPAQLNGKAVKSSRKIKIEFEIE